MSTLPIAPVFLDIVFSLILVIIGFVIFTGSLSDYRLVSSIKRLISKSISINLVNVKQSAVIQLYQRGMIRGYFKVTDAFLKNPSLGSILVGEDKVTVRFAEGIKTPTNTELILVVNVRGRLDEYYIKSRIRIGVKLAE